MKETTHWDYVVIGAGSAGCALTHELVESGATVLVLEAGGSDCSPYIKIPAYVIQAITRHDWGFEGQPDPTRNGVRERWFRGRVLGGSSSINGMKFVRPSAASLDRWSALCGHAGGWSGRELMPILRDLETSDQDGPLRGKNGPLSVRTVKRPHPITDAFIQSACAAGYPFTPDYNGENPEGVAYVQLSQRRGLRCSAADAFLKPHLGKRNLKLRLRALVKKIEISEGRANGVLFEHEGKLHRVSGGQIVLSAGVINSPRLLMLSGVGDPAELNRHGIDPVLNLPGVGLGFHDQPFVRPGYRTNVPTNNLTEGLGQKLSIAMQFLLHGEGPVSSLFEGTASLKSSDSEPKPDVRLTFYPMLVRPKPDGLFGLAPYPGIMLSLTKAHPVSRGRVRLRSSNPSDTPLIEYGLLESRADIDTLIRGLGVIREIVKTEPIASLIEEEVEPGYDLDGPAALEKFVRARASVPQNAVGSCRMGIDDNAVVGPDLRVRGTENLWIADASIMPEQIGHDTNATCMMIGAKLGRSFVGRTIHLNFVSAEALQPSPRLVLTEGACNGDRNIWA